MAPEFSRSHLQTLIEGGHVRVGGQRATAASRKVRAGEHVEVELVPTAESRAFRPEPIGLRIVFEDEHLVVIDKPAGLVVHPAAGNWTGTLLNGLLARYPSSASLPRAGIVHRLDKDTSGLMVVGLTLPAVTALTREIGARQVHREYLAIAHGEAREAAFSIDAPIGRDPQSRVRMAVVSFGQAGAHRRARGRPARRLVGPGMHVAYRAHAPDSRPPGIARPSPGGRCHLRRCPCARPDAPGAARSAPRVPAPGRGRGARVPGSSPAGLREGLGRGHGRIRNTLIAGPVPWVQWVFLPGTGQRTQDVPDESATRQVHREVSRSPRRSVLRDATPAASPIRRSRSAPSEPGTWVAPAQRETSRRISTGPAGRGCRRNT